MGIDIISGRKLVALASKLEHKATVLMLGRQKFSLKDRFVPLFNKALRQNGFENVTYKDCVQEDGYSETLLTALGFSQIHTLDISDFEGADIIHDLNAPISADFEDKFDVILDIGTSEHIFDVAGCATNLAKMLKTGGVLVSCVPANGWTAHGLYQFGPELVFALWKRACRFDVMNCCLTSILPRGGELDIKDQVVSGRRIRLRNKLPPGRVYLYFEVLKTDKSRLPERILQTDYVETWAEYDVSMGRDSDLRDLRNAHIDLVRTEDGQTQ